jgi:transcriptional regulator with XRE-family HTH domain
MTGFGARLAEERKRLGLRQGAFADRVGTAVPKQSLYENGHRELRAAYLSRAAAAGVDVLYVLTGRRSSGHWLGDDVDALLLAYRSLPRGLRPAVLRLLDDLGRYMSKGAGRAP